MSFPADYSQGVPSPLEELVHPTWLSILDGQRDALQHIGEFLRAQTAAGRPWAPQGDHILRAFQQPRTNIRVVIVGQDPYPTPGHAVGLSFSLAPEVKPLARSLVNIFRELVDDIGCPQPTNGDLTPWAERGVLLMNRVLTVQQGKPGSHRGKGWENFTDVALRGLVESREQPLVAILWGKDAQATAPIFADIPIIASAHPSPMSADRGFFGSRPFSRANTELLTRGASPIDWSLP
jgi:uracil-DNA glycosylase